MFFLNIIQLRNIIMAQARFLTISQEARKVVLNSVLNPVKVYEKDGYKIFGIKGTIIWVIR